VADQGQILVIRKIDDDPAGDYLPVYPLETYAIPFCDQLLEATDRCTLEDIDVVEWLVPPSAHIPVPGRHEHDESVQPALMGFTEREPAPVAIMCRTQKPAGLVHLNVWPRRVVVETSQGPRPTRRWQYPLSKLVYQSILQFEADIKPESVVIAGGAERAIVVSRPDAGDGTALRLSGYAAPNIRTSEPALRGQLWSEDEEAASADVVRRVQLEAIRGPIRVNALAALPLSTEVYEELCTGGMGAVAFDETIARVCVSSKNSKRVYMFDYSKAAQLPEF
jgi:hypothetical protein